MTKRITPLVLIAAWLSVRAVAAPIPPAPLYAAGTAIVEAEATAGPSARADADRSSPAAAPGAGVAAVAAVAADPEPSADAAGLSAELQNIIRRPGWRGDRWSVMVVSLDRGDTLFAYNAHERLAPASNMKLFTTAAALYYLGADYRWNTFLMATGPVSDGVLSGDLVVYGTGDPTFSGRFGSALAVWQAFADSLEALGVREVRGDIVGDGSYFHGSGAGEGWQHSYMNASYAATAGALSYAENVATLQIAPAQQSGWRPTVSLLPGGEGVAVVNQARTVAGGATRIHVARMAYDGPVVVSGQIARGSAPVTRAVPVSDPERFAAAIFREVLTRRGIVVTGTVRSALTEAESPVTGRSIFAPALDSREPLRVLAVHTSEPIMRVLEIINKRSHNLMAEQVLRTVGRVAVGHGSVDGGRRALEHMMRVEGHAAPGEIAVYDGSGLSVLNRSSAHGIVSLLAVMAQSPSWEQYWETLPEAAGSGGLRRMHQTAAAGNLRAKTGTIDRVSALSGYVRAANGERLAFAIISNNVPSTWQAKRIEDAIGARLAEYRRPGEGGVAAPSGPPRGTRGTTSPAERGSTAADAAAPQSGRTYRIRSGDTLDGIARRNNTTVRALQAANPGLNPRRLIPGRTIRLP
jgi:serine-type D-Ala-D-Ala carboxypeptidase/endopeptidase (penicillin-binding protein 4)